MKRKKPPVANKEVNVNANTFHMEFLNSSQKLAWSIFQKHDLLCLIGPAGVGKTYLAMAFAINEILSGKYFKIVLTRPIVEAGENLGFLPGTFDEKVRPYMMPLFDSVNKLCKNSAQRDIINRSLEVCPLAYLRGRTVDNAIFILDEAQNATETQLRLALTRLGTTSKMIITGDPTQSDLRGRIALVDLLAKIEDIQGIGSVHFKESSIVRHPLVAKIIKKLDETKEE